MKAALHNLGCKVNQYETDAMENMLREAGFEIVPFTEKADVYVINTCSVTNMADRKSRQMIHRVHKLNPQAAVVAAGCYVQTSEEQAKADEAIDIIIGNNQKTKLVEMLDKYFDEHLEDLNDLPSNDKVESLIDIRNTENPYEKLIVKHTSEHTRAFIKVQDGCNQFCTYCIIPYARGPVRSRKMEDIHDEIVALSRTDIKEVVITGIHISSYGKDLENKPTLIDLLEYIHQIPGIERIRLGSLEPLIVTEDFVCRLKKLSKVCNHFHLSLQSGCDETLKRMNRRYTTDEFRKIVSLLKNHIPEVALTTDVIVGFPGETNEEFETTYEFLKEINFSKMHVFKYSPRKGTKAAGFPNQVDGKIKDERSSRLIELSMKNEEAFASQYLGKEIEVLFENEHDGHTTNYIEVYSKEEQKPNEIVRCVARNWDGEKIIV